MFVSCIVPFCFTGLDLHDTTVLYPLPKSFDLRRKWLNALKLSESNTSTSPNAAICSKHLNIPAFARCISEAEEVVNSMFQSANSSDSETGQVMSVAKLVQKQIHDKLSWKHRNQFGQAANVRVTPKSQDIAFVDCHIPHAPKPTFHGSIDKGVNVPDDVPFVPKPIERIDPKSQLSTTVQINRNLKTTKLSTLQNLPTLPLQKPSISSGQTKANMLAGSNKKPTHSSKELPRLPVSFYIDRQGIKKPYFAWQRQASQTTGNNTKTLTRTYSGPNPTSQKLSKQMLANQTTANKNRAQAAKTQTSQVPTIQPLGSKTITNQTVAGTSTGPSSTIQSPNDQLPASKKQTIQAPAAKIQKSQALTIHTQGKNTPTNKTVIRTFTGPNPTSQTPGNKTLIQSPAAKTQANQVQKTQPLVKKTLTSQTLIRTSTGPAQSNQTLIRKYTGRTPTMQAPSNQPLGIKTKVIEVPSTQTLGSKTQVNQTLTTVSASSTSTIQTLIHKTPANQKTGTMMRAIQPAQAKTQTSQVPTTDTLGCKHEINQTFSSVSAGSTPTIQTLINKTSANQKTGTKMQAIQPAQAKTQTGQVPTAHTLGSKTEINQTLFRVSAGPTTGQTSKSRTLANHRTGNNIRTIQPTPATSKEPSRNTLGSTMPTDQTVTRMSTGPTPTSQTLTSKTAAPGSKMYVSKTLVSQPPTSQNPLMKPPSSHTLTSQTSSTSTGIIQITHTANDQAPGSEIYASNAQVTFDKKLIDIQNKFGIVISKVEQPQPDSVKQSVDIVTPFQIDVKRPSATRKPLQKNVSSTAISRSDALPLAAIRPPSANTSASSQILIDQNASLNRKLLRPNIPKRQYKALHFKRTENCTNRLQKLPAPLPASQRLVKPKPHIESTTESLIITIDEDDVPDINSVVSTEEMSPVLPMSVVTRPAFSNQPKPQSKVEPFQLISVVDLLAKSATIVIDDDEEILPKEIAKESSTISTEKLIYKERWLANSTTEMQPVPPIKCQEVSVANSSDSIKVAVSAIRLDAANKIADALDKLLNPIGEAEFTSSDGQRKKKRTKFQCDNCLQFFDRLYKIKRHIFLSSLDPSECSQHKAKTINNATVEENPIIAMQTNEEQSADCEMGNVISAKDIQINICGDTTGLAVQKKNEAKKTTVPKRSKIVAKKTLTKAIKPTIVKRKYIKRQPKKSPIIITPTVLDAENSDSDATTISVTSNALCPLDLDLPRIELLNGEGHAMVAIPRQSLSINLDFDQWINSLAPTTEIKKEINTDITPAKKQTKRRRKKPFVRRQRRLQVNKNATIPPRASDRQVSKRKPETKAISYNSRRINTRLAASLMVELPNPSYQHSSTEPKDRRASKRKISSTVEQAKQVPFNSRRRNTRLAASLMVELPNPSYQHSTAEPQAKRQKRKR